MTMSRLLTHLLVLPLLGPAFSGCAADPGDDAPGATSLIPPSSTTADTAGDESSPGACEDEGTWCSGDGQCCDGLQCIDFECQSCPAAHPVFCPAGAGFDAGCWSDGTDCSTRTDCGDELLACDHDFLAVDCVERTCECTNPEYPKFCPALGEVPASCWTPGTVCSTVESCDGDFKACSTADAYVDCAANTCVPTGGSASGGDDSSDECSYDSDCSYDEVCEYGSCVEPECTYNGDCYGCQRCSDNKCIICVEGPYGCTC